MSLFTKSYIQHVTAGLGFLFPHPFPDILNILGDPQLEDVKLSGGSSVVNKTFLLLRLDGRRQKNIHIRNE